MQNLNFEGHFDAASAKVDITVGLLQFEEGGNTIIYCPSFDLSGYGKNPEEAKKSFEITVAEFFRYTLNKKTLTKELNRLGWNIKQADVKNRKFKTPGLAELITKNDYLQEILNEKEFTKFDQTIAMPC